MTVMQVSQYAHRLNLSASLCAIIAMQVSQYAQRFNLSASLASSITRLSSWVSSALLLALLSVTGTHMHHLAAAQEAVSVTNLVTAVRWPLLAVAATAAAVLMISVPVAASLAKKSRSQGPKRSQAAAAGNTSPPAAESVGLKAGSAESLAATHESEVNGAGTVGPERSSAVADELAEHAAVEGPEQEPSEATISDPATLPGDSQAADTGSSSSNVGTAGLGLDSNVHKGPDKQGSRQADGDSASGTADGAMEGPVEGPVERPVEEPSEDVISDPATLPDESQASGNGDDVNVGTPGFGDSDVGNDNVRKGPDQHGGSHDDKYSSAKYNEESQIAESEAQSPAEGSGRGKRGGFFRDIETNCMPVRRQRRAPLRPRACYGRHVRHAPCCMKLFRRSQVDSAITIRNARGRSRWLRVT